MNEMNFKKGDRIEVTSTTDECLGVGDRATLEYQDSSGDWWAIFDELEWSSSDRLFCLESGYTEFKLV